MTNTLLTLNTSFTAALAGGVLIGLAVVVLLLTNGRLLGVSGIVAGLLTWQPGETAWRVAFCAGLLSGGGLLLWWYPETFAAAGNRSLAITALAGLLVGFGTRLGSGCTSGHGVCGISRLSPRSFVATLVFMATGMLTVWAINRFLGGSL